MKRALPIALVILAGGVAYHWWSGRHPSTGNSQGGEESSRALSHHTKGGAPETLRMWWQEGFEYRYRFTQRTQVQADSGDAAALELLGDIHISRISPRLVRYRFQGAQVAPGAPNAAPQNDGALREPFFLEHHIAGQQRLKVAPNVDESTSQIWKSLLATIRFEWPDGVRNAWERKEDGPLGTCGVTYAELAPGRVQKRRLSCQAPQGMNVVAFRGQASVQDFVFTDMRIDRVSSEESIETEADQGVPSFRSATTLTLQYLDSRSCAKELAAWRKTADAMMSTLVALSPAPAGSERDLADLAARIGDRTFPGVMAKLTELDALAGQRKLTSDENAAFGRAFIALRSMLMLNDEYLDEIEEHVLAEGPLTQHLLGVLGEAGTPEAQRVLSAYMADLNHGARNRTLAGIALGRVEQPTAESVAVLDSLQSDPSVATQATYSLGSNVRRLGSSNPELGRKVLNGLLDDLNAAPVDDRARYLTALGNAGAPDSLATLREFATGPIPKNRRDAAFGLRRIPGSEAEDLLLRLLADPEPQVRAQAASSIVSRDPSEPLIQAIATFIVSEPVYIPRVRAVEGATRWLRVAPALGPALRTVAERDTAENLRLMAADALQRYPG